MREVRKYSALVFLLIFGWYFASINLFSHIHIVNGQSIVHSHFGGNTSHEHSNSEYTVIDLLSNFQSEAGCSHHINPTYLYLSSEIYLDYASPFIQSTIHSSMSLRGPPQA